MDKSKSFEIWTILLQNTSSLSGGIIKSTPSVKKKSNYKNERTNAYLDSFLEVDFFFIEGEIIDINTGLFRELKISRSISTSDMWSVRH